MRQMERHRTNTGYTVLDISDRFNDMTDTYNNVPIAEMLRPEWIITWLLPHVSTGRIMHDSCLLHCEHNVE